MGRGGEPQVVAPSPFVVSLDDETDGRLEFVNQYVRCANLVTQLSKLCHVALVRCRRDTSAKTLR